MRTSTANDLAASVSRSDDQLYDVLSDERRRYALAYLRDAESPVPDEELAAAVAAWETRTESGDADEAVRRDVEIALHHNHLPRMADAGVIRRTPEGVALSERAAPALALLPA